MLLFWLVSLWLSLSFRLLSGLFVIEGCSLVDDGMVVVDMGLRLFGGWGD